MIHVFKFKFAFAYISMILVVINLSHTELYGQIVLQGFVYSAIDSLPVSGASLYDGVSKRVQTNPKGFFRLQASVGSEDIEISALGYAATKLSVPKIDTLLSIYLTKEVSHIQEVVVNTGYQRLPKERSTGSFVQIDSVTLNNRVTTNILERLDGIAPGLQFDNRSSSGPSINIRGINTFSSALTRPLIVVDNFPFEGDLANVNPNDVQSVTLLKDAAATSIWGARAGNGVIVINTKKPRAGKTLVNISSNTTVGDKPNLFYDQLMTSSDFIDVERMLYENGFYANLINGVNANRTVFSPVVHLLRDVESGELSSEKADQAIETYRSLDYRNEMLAHFYQLSLNQQYYANLSGGNPSHTYRVSVGYDRNRPNRVRSNLERTTLRATNNFRPLAQLEVNTVFAYVRSRNSSSVSGAGQYPINPGGGREVLYPYARLLDDGGSSLSIPYQYNYRFIQQLRDSPLLDWSMKPYEDLNHNLLSNYTDHTTANLTIGYKLPFNLQINGLYAFEKQIGRMETLYGEESFYARNQVNRFTQINGGIVKRIVPEGGILNSNSSTMESHRGRLQLSFDQTYRDRHEVIVFAGAELLHRPNRAAGFRIYGFDEKLLTGQQVDYANTYPIYGGLASNSRILPFGGVSAGLKRFVSVYGNMGYTYNRKYTFSLSARRDASNLFGVATNERWNPLWSAGVAWKLSDEPLLRKVSWIDYVRLRGTYGHSGNSGGMSSTLPIISYLDPSSQWRTDLQRALVTTLPNPHLKWEDVRMINFGLDFSLLEGRISGSFEYFNKKSSDLLSDDSLDPTTGFSSIRRNVGEAMGRGLDLQLNTINFSGNVQWKTSFILSKSNDWVTQYYGNELPAISYTSFSGSDLRPTRDRLLYPVFSYRFAGLDPNTGNPRGYLDGAPSEDYNSLVTDSIGNLNYHGTALPPYYGSVVNTWRWKNIRLFINVTYKFGHYFQRRTIRYHALFNNWTSHTDFAKRWQQPGDERWTTVPSMTYPANAARDDFYANSDANIEPGGLIRLQDVKLAYTFRPVFYNRSIPITLNFNINNVALLWTANVSDLDPDYFELPPPRTYTIGVVASF